MSKKKEVKVNSLFDGVKNKSEKINSVEFKETLSPESGLNIKGDDLYWYPNEMKHENNYIEVNDDLSSIL